MEHKNTIYDSYSNMAKKINTKEGVLLESFFIGVNGLLENIITMPVLDSFKQGIISDNKDCLKDYNNLKNTIRKAIISMRRFGECIIIKNNNIVIDYDKYNSLNIDNNPISKTYLQYKDIDVYGEVIKSKDFILVRSDAPNEFIESYYRGYTILELIELPLKLYLSSITISTDILGKLNQSVIKMQDLHDKLQEEGGEVDLLARLDLINYLASNNSILLLDGEDEFVNVNKTLAGVNDLIKTNALNLCAVSKIPYSRLFGQGSTGLNVSGDHDLKLYYDNVVSSIQENFIKPIFDKLTDYKYNYEFKPLYDISSTEKSQIFERDTKTLLTLFENNIINEDLIKNRLQLV